MIAQVPELADGGYWYVVPVVAGDDGILSPDCAPSYCAAYGEVAGALYALVRKPHPETMHYIGIKAVDVIDSAMTNGSLPSATKPLMRVGGR